MSKLSCQIGSKDFDIGLDDDFYDFFIEKFRQDFPDKRNIEVKELLRAYVQKCYDEYKDSKNIEQIFKSISEI